MSSRILYTYIFIIIVVCYPGMWCNRISENDGTEDNHLPIITKEVANSFLLSCCTHPTSKKLRRHILKRGKPNGSKSKNVTVCP